MPRRKPTSNVGTALARFNALRHGITSDAPVIPGVESVDEWEAHLAAFIEDRAPQGALESALVERIASLAWRLRRVDRYESESIAVGRERVEFDFAHNQLWTDAPATVADAEQRTEDARRCLDILESLLHIPPATPLAASDAEAILDELAAHADQDPDDFFEGIDEYDADDRWTTGRLLAVLKAVAAREGDAFADLLADTVLRAGDIANGRELEIARAREEMDRMRRERLLPDGPALDRIIRHGASLNRQFHQALAQLEAAQARRAGRPAPLHRVQAFGLPGG